MKLKALAGFAQKYGDAFHRIEALAEVDGQMKVIDLKTDPVREAVGSAKGNALTLYSSTIAANYDSKRQ